VRKKKKGRCFGAWVCWSGYVTKKTNETNNLSLALYYIGSSVGEESGICHLRDFDLAFGQQEVIDARRQPRVCEK
jgi:hypothetical protein